MPTLKFDAHDFCEWFDLGHPDEAEIFYDEPIRDSEVEDKMEEYGIKKTEENESLVRDAIRLTIERDTGDKYFKHWEEAVQEILDTFSDYKYEYFSEGEFKSYSGQSKGVLSYDINWETITVEVADDFYHVINDCLAGYGMFDPQGEEPMDEGEMEGNFHNLNQYWKIYGTSRPGMPDSVDWEYSEKTFRQMLDEQGVKIRKRK